MRKLLPGTLLWGGAFLAAQFVRLVIRVNLHEWARILWHPRRHHLVHQGTKSSRFWFHFFAVAFVPLLHGLSILFSVLLVRYHEVTIGRVVLRSTACRLESVTVVTTEPDYFGPDHPWWFLMYGNGFNPAKWYFTSFLLPRIVWVWPVSPTIERVGKIMIQTKETLTSMSIATKKLLSALRLGVKLTKWTSQVLLGSIILRIIYTSYWSWEDSDWAKLENGAPSEETCNEWYKFDYGRPMDIYYEYILSVGLLVHTTICAVFAERSFHPARKHLEKKRLRTHQHKQERLEFVQRFTHVARTSLACVRPLVKRLRMQLQQEEMMSKGSVTPHVLPSQVSSIFQSMKLPLSLPPAQLSPDVVRRPSAQSVLDKACAPRKVVSHNLKETERCLRILQISETATRVLIERLVHFYTLRQASIRLVLRPCDLVQVVKDVLLAEEVKNLDSNWASTASLRSSSSAKTRIRFVCVQQMLVGKTDRNYIHLCLTNLVGNAVKYCVRPDDPGFIPNIIVRLERVSRSSGDDTVDFVRFEIRDNGVGMTPKQLREVRGTPSELSTSASEAAEEDEDDWEPRRQVMSAGIGLEIVKSLTRLFGGSIKFESVGMGRGTTVCWEIPMSIMEDSVVPASPLKNKMPPVEILQDLCVVVAEDHHILQKIYRQRLKNLGVKDFTILGDGKKLVDHCKMYREKLLSSLLVLVVDINMPKLCGDEAVSLIREIPGFKSVPIFACTATVRRESKDTYCKTYGFTDLFEKPLEPHIYAELLHRGRKFYDDAGKLCGPACARMAVPISESPKPTASETEVGTLSALAFIGERASSVFKMWFGKSAEKDIKKSQMGSTMIVLEEEAYQREEEVREKLRKNHGFLMRGIFAGISVVGSMCTLLPGIPPAYFILGLHSFCEMVLGPIVFVLLKKLALLKDPKPESLVGIMVFTCIWCVIIPRPIGDIEFVLLGCHALPYASRLLRGGQFLTYVAMFALTRLLSVFQISAFRNCAYLRDGALAVMWVNHWWIPISSISTYCLFGVLDAHERELLTMAVHEGDRLTQVQDQIISSSIHDLRNQVGGMFWAAGQLHAHLPHLFEITMQLVSSLSFFSEGCEQLTEYFRLKNGRLQLLERDGIPLKLFLEQIMMREKSYHHNPKVRFISEILVSPKLRVGCDPIRLRSILGNLISNAFKFTEKGEISYKIGCTVVDNEKVILKVTVSDSGRGMSEDKIHEVSLDPFDGCSRLSVDSSLSVGFGIFVHIKVARMMGGYLHHRSNAPKRGVTAELQVDLAVSKTTDTKFCAKSALLIDDSTVCQLIVSKMLQRCKVNDVTTVGNLTDARKVLKTKKKFDVAFVDVHLGLEMGSDLIKFGELQNSCERIVLLSGDDPSIWKEFQERFRLFGVYRKPLFKEDVLSVVGRESC